MSLTASIFFLLIGGAVLVGVCFSLISSHFNKIVKAKEEQIRALELENTALRSQKSAQEEHYAMQEERFKEQLQMMKSEFKALSSDITRESTEQMTRYNKREMDAILTPLKDNIAKMEMKISNSDTESAKRVGALEKHIENLMMHTNDLGSKADHLSEALMQNKKIQGNWGEMLLENIFQNEGWMRGREYEAQKTLKTETGDTIIPDFLVNLPDNRVVVIDSKVSLNAYVEYTATQDDAEQAKYAKALVENMSKQIKDLSEHKYSKYVGKPSVALDFVIMYVPITAALQLALETKPSLWRDAYKKGVFIAGNHNLMAAIHIIDDLWSQDKQNKNIELIVDQARKMLDKVSRFHDSFRSIHVRLQEIETSKRKAEDEYNKAYNLIYDESKGIVGSAHKIQALGAKPSPNKTLPDAINDKSQTLV